ncbi:GNAT family N-acetyltransferase [candidate division CSSED10-310 bacterium]|uniref:GNAT family N-acetyltransferase n=1 Tax=candidate division CSSED10-310 bacterium TaxID=2855610 RepID=A0ABV6Z086_UNCC1
MTSSEQTDSPICAIRFATKSDTGLIVQLIKELADYEKLSHEVVVDEMTLRETLFHQRQVAEVLIAEYQGLPVGFALFFHNYSTFLGKPGLYLEDLFVKPHLRGLGIGKHLLTYLAKIALERGCGRLEGSVLDWNKSAIDFYLNLGAQPMSDWTVFRLTGQALINLTKQ